MNILKRVKITSQKSCRKRKISNAIFAPELEQLTKPAIFSIMNNHIINIKSKFVNCKHTLIPCLKINKRKRPVQIREYQISLH